MVSSGHADPPAFVALAAHPVRWALLTELAGSDYRVRELVERVGEPQNLVSYHLRLLRGGGLVTARRSSFDGRDSYYHLDLDRCAEALAETGAALHPALRHDAPIPAAGRRGTAADGALRKRPYVLFVCTGNSARSPIAEALLHHHAAGRTSVASAGVQPKPRLHPGAVRVLREEYGIDVAGQRPRPLDTVARRRIHYVITLCDKAREVCPEFDNDPRRIHWSIPDPDTTSAFRHVAADIDTRVRHLLPALTADHKEVPS